MLRCDRGHISRPPFSDVYADGRLTSEMPFLCIRRYRVVHEILRGFFLCRKRDSVLPFWKRKILLSPRMYSLPCGFRQHVLPNCAAVSSAAAGCPWWCIATAELGRVARHRGASKRTLPG
jgi:hypothetical protein